MKIRKLFPDKKNDNLAEFKLSILIHVAILLALTAFFAWRQANAEPIKKKVVPVRLISPVNTPKVGSGHKHKTKASSKKSKGKSKRKTKSRKKKIAKRQKSTAKKVKKSPKKHITRTNKKTTKKIVKKNTVKRSKTPVKVEGAKKSPTVVKTPEIVKAIVKPTHNNPTFESIDHMTMERSSSTMTDEGLTGNIMNDEITNNDMPSFSPSDISEKTQDKFMPTPTGADNSKLNEGSGDVKIGSIESFGGTSEHFVPPTIISKKMPDYPTWARKKGVRGRATYRVLIQEAGTVGDVVTMSSTIDPKLAINGAQSLRRWMFTPVLENGEPKETWVKITVTYSLD